MAVLQPFESGQIHYEYDTIAIPGVRQNKGYVISGFTPSERGAGANMSVDVAAGQGVDGAGNYESEGATTNVAITAAHASLDRIDLLIYDASGNTPAVIDGIASANPNVPDLTDDNDIVIGRVHVTATTTQINDSDIYDLTVPQSEPIIRETRSFYNSSDVILYSDDGSTATVTLDGGAGTITTTSNILMGAGGIGNDNPIITFASGASGLSTFTGSIESNGTAITLDSAAGAVIVVDAGSGDPTLDFYEVGGSKATIKYNTGSNRLDLATTTSGEGIYLDCGGSGTITLADAVDVTGGSIDIDTATDPTLTFSESTVTKATIYYDTGSNYLSISTSVSGEGIILDTGGTANVVSADHFVPDTDSQDNLGADGQKWATAYYDTADTSDPTSWNDYDCLSMLIEPNMWKDRSKESKYYISKITNTIQLDPSTCPIEMQDVYMHRSRYQEWLKAPENERRPKPPNRNPDDPNYDPQEIGLLINDLVTFNNKCLRELYPKYLELEKKVRKLESNRNYNNIH